MDAPDVPARAPSPTLAFLLLPLSLPPSSLLSSTPSRNSYQGRPLFSSFSLTRATSSSHSHRAMFYSDAILSRKGALAKVWLAAHMESRLTKGQVGAVDVEQSVSAYNSLVTSRPGR